jgi:hypothetical protein
MPNWYLNSMGWIVSFLRYAALRLFWTLRGQGRHNVIKKYRGGLKALKALMAHTSPRCCRRLKALMAHNAHTSPRRCGGLMRIVRLMRTLPPAPDPHAAITLGSRGTPGLDRYLDLTAATLDR